MLKVEIIRYDGLTDEEKEFQPNNGPGKEYANYVKVTNGDTVVAILSDAIEPEDKTFRRELKSVADVIQKAYEIGVEEGFKL